jgi:DNA repair protein RadD
MTFNSKPQPYPKQEEFIDGVRVAMLKTKAVIAQAPTGFGKTIVATSVVDSAYQKGSSTIFLVHRKELLEQTSKTFSRFNIPHGFIAAGRKDVPGTIIKIASIDTLRGRLEKTEVPKLLIMDECHRGGSTFAKVVEWAKAGDAYIIGLTATPWRLDKKGLGDYFDEMVLGPSTGWLIENGFLSTYKAYAPYLPDLKNVKTKMGDYDIEKIEEIMSGNAIIDGAVENYEKFSKGKKTIGFAPTVALSKILAHRFLNAGISSAHVDGETASEERKKILFDFANGKIDVLWNVGLFCEGLDLSAMTGLDVPIEAVILYRPTKSLSLHLQQCGRALRKKPEPAIILDFAGNLLRHGFPDSEFKWSLEGRKKKKEKLIEMMRCPYCHHLFLPANNCPSCGLVMSCSEDNKAEREINIIAGELREVTKDDLLKIRKAAKKKISEAKTKAELEEIRKECGYKRGWIYFMALAKNIK